MSAGSALAVYSVVTKARAFHTLLLFSRARAEQLSRIDGPKTPDRFADVGWPIGPESGNEVGEVLAQILRVRGLQPYLLVTAVHPPDLEIGHCSLNRPVLASPTRQEHDVDEPDDAEANVHEYTDRPRSGHPDDSAREDLAEAQSTLNSLPLCFRHHSCILAPHWGGQESPVRASTHPGLNI